MSLVVRAAVPADGAALVAFNLALAQAAEGRQLDRQRLARGAASWGLPGPGDLSPVGMGPAAYELYEGDFVLGGASLSTD